MGSDTDNQQGDETIALCTKDATLCGGTPDDCWDRIGRCYRISDHAMTLVERMAALATREGQGDFADFMLAITTVCIDAHDFLLAVQGGQEEGEHSG